jgi:MFS family permease
VSGFLVGAVSNDTEYYLMAAATIGCLGGIIGIIGGAILGAIYAPKTSDRLSEGGRRIIMGAIIGIGVGLLGGAIAQVIDHTLVYLISESVRSEQSWMEILLDDWSLLWISGIFPGAIAGTSVATVLGLSANHTKTGSTP